MKLCLLFFSVFLQPQQITICHFVINGIVFNLYIVMFKQSRLFPFATTPTPSPLSDTGDSFLNRHINISSPSLFLCSVCSTSPRVCCHYSTDSIIYIHILHIHILCIIVKHCNHSCYLYYSLCGLFCFFSVY